MGIWDRQRVPPGARWYACAECHRELTFAMVEEMGRIDGNSFYLSHTCECVPATYVFERHLSVDTSALARMLGSIRPVLPYRAAPAAPAPLKDTQETALRVFRWECETLEGVGDFLLFCSRPPLR